MRWDPSIQASKTWAGIGSLQRVLGPQGLSPAPGKVLERFCKRVKSNGMVVVPHLCKQGTATSLRSGECHVVTYVEREGQPAGDNYILPEPVFAPISKPSGIFPFQTESVPNLTPIKQKQVILLTIFKSSKL